MPKNDLFSQILQLGNAGCGKTVLVNEKLASMSENYALCNVPFNFYTTSEMLQKVLEKPLEKKAGRNYGPPGSKTMIYFIDGEILNSNWNGSNFSFK